MLQLIPAGARIVARHPSSSPSDRAPDMSMLRTPPSLRLALIVPYVILVVGLALAIGVLS